MTIGRADSPAEVVAGLMELRDVAVVACSAERLAPGDGKRLHLSLASGTASAEHSLAFTFDVAGRLVGERSRPVADVSLSLVATYAPRDASLRDRLDLTDRVAVTAFSDTVAWLDVYPFVREGVASLMARLGLYGYATLVLRGEG
ncbi:hypothetical protein [Rhizohabitans arisaemae]|uniref:hypothetical protein n=1 Tax=Rhizohabitans arisaemae TaxID=2720610 RepID=UPI0024B12B08|nr:hypothetical protein [Rhizohabitans arisaemae]